MTRWNKFRKSQRCMQCFLDSERGDKHHSWNPDRAAVELRRNLHIKSKHMLHHTLQATGKRKLARSADILGYTTEQLKKRLTSHPNWLSVKDGKWSIDHIFPVKAFLDHGITDLKLINCLENLQPMQWKDNLRKNGKYSLDEFLAWLRTKEDML